VGGDKIKTNGKMEGSVKWINLTPVMKEFQAPSKCKLNFCFPKKVEIFACLT
jgi:hypothetical protein